MARMDGRRAGELRPVAIERGVVKDVGGAVLIRAGRTHVLCTACIEESLPKWREASGQGWVTAEYDMLPASTGSRRKRSRDGKIDGRTHEIQRLVGRSLRAVVDMKRLGPRTITIDCDVIQADGGTRTACITGAYVALVDAIRGLLKSKAVRENPIVDSVAAVSVGWVKGRALLDLDYEEDHRADVDFNIVQTGAGRFVEVQGTGEGGTFDAAQMRRIVALGEKGIRRLLEIQTKALRGRLSR